MYAVFEYTSDCTIECVPFDITGGINNGQNNVGGTVSIQTDKGTASGTITQSLKATRNSSVTVNAVAASGYEFLGWKKASPYVQNFVATTASYTFDINEELYLYAVFQEVSTPKYNVTGTVKAYNSGSAPVVKLYSNGVAKYTAQVNDPAVSGNQHTWYFTFSGVAPGTYDLVVTKAGHLTYTITNVLVADSDINLSNHANAAICTITMLCGDMNSDGNINVTDLNTVWNAANYNKAVQRCG